VRNTANGAFALLSNTTGGNNTAIGDFALFNNTSGSNNIAVGASAGNSVTTANSVICIGANVVGANVSNSCYIDNIRGFQTQNANAIPVLIDSTGQLGTLSFSRRFKKEIKPMNKASEVIHALEPVMFHYKSDKTDTLQFGLIAEEVAEVNPDLVVRDKNGEIYTVRYEAVNAMLLNEFLKEHKKVEGQQATIAEQQASIAELKSTVAQQQKGMEVLTA
jgi:Chaperone of endosialidase